MALLRRYVYCVKPGSNGCVNDDDAISADAGWMHWCPGCNSPHGIAVEHPLENGARWTFNGDQAKPTFSPSVRVGPWGAADGKQHVCHYFIVDGEIRYCGDCTHALNGKTVPLPEWPYGE